MFQMLADAWHLWIGLTAVSVAALGLALAVPTAAVPDAAGLAETVDAVASSEYGATETHRIDAERLWLGPHRVGLRNDAGTARATFAFGPVVPAFASENLSAVLHGRDPGAVFGSTASFREAARTARNRTVRWRDAPEQVRVRHVVRGGNGVTLVG